MILNRVVLRTSAKYVPRGVGVVGVEHCTGYRDHGRNCGAGPTVGRCRLHSGDRCFALGLGNASNNYRRRRQRRVACCLQYGGFSNIGTYLQAGDLQCCLPPATGAGHEQALSVVSTVQRRAAARRFYLYLQLQKNW